MWNNVNIVWNAFCVCVCVRACKITILLFIECSMYDASASIYYVKEIRISLVPDYI